MQTLDAEDVVDAVVVGAGVVGLAVARALALQGRQVWVLDAADRIGSGTSSRNSEVLHAGLYYPSGSLKARLCVQGQAQLYAYCAERAIPHQRCGKLVVATQDGQHVQLEAIAAQARANGVPDLRWLSGAQARALEPELACVAALHVPGTGIIDSHALMLALLADIENAGGLLALHTQVAQAQPSAHGWQLTMADGTELHARTWVNAAGLHAPALAQRTSGLPATHQPRAYFAKGSYFTLAARAPFRHLIYPVPEAAGLGIHLTLDLAGQAKFGPDVAWVDTPDDWVVDPARRSAFADAVRRYWPGVPEDALQPGYAGIRPKISGPHEPSADFAIHGPADHGLPGLVNLFGIESPGLTSCLALGAEVAARL